MLTDGTTNGGTAMTSSLEQPPIRHTDAWQHQLQAYHFAFGRDATMLAMDMGTGKSKAAIDLLVNWDVRNVLIISPVSVRDVWRREFNRHAPGHFSPLILERGTAAAKQLAAASHVATAKRRNTPAAVVLNYETAKLPGFASWALSQRWDAVIADESHRTKAHNSAISKFMAKLVRVSDRRICLTGTPMPHSPLDVFGQYRFLDPTIFGASWFRFKQRYALTGNPHIPQQITGYQRIDELQEKFASIAYRVKASDVLDLPGSIHERRSCQLSNKARRIYADLRDELVAEIEGGFCTVANALVRSLRLRQVVSGYVTDDDTKATQRIDDGKQRLLADLLADLPQREPVVVFCEFRHDMERIREVAEADSRRYGELSGRAHDLTDEATMPEGIDVLAAQYQSGGVGVDLSRARYCIYYSPTYRLGDYEQSLARTLRPGQTRNVVYYHLVADDTIDTAVYDALRKKKSVVEEVLSVLRGS